MIESSKADNHTHSLMKKAMFLLALTLIYNIIESGVSIWAGVEADSIALVGFGVDAIIEFLAASIVLLAAWNLYRQNKQGNDELAERFVGVSFFILAAYILWEAYNRFMTQSAPDESMVGIVIAVLSIVIMPTLAVFKLKVANQLGSKMLKAEAKETIACTLLSVILLLGLVVNNVFGWWWADPIAALLMVPWLIKEGLEAFNTECCC